MIGFLSGKIKFNGDGYLIVDVGGVGYKVEMGGGGFIEGDPIELFIYTHVREQELRLFGFKTSDELSLFEKLLSVPGVGPKTALALITELGVSGIVEAIKLDNPVGLKVSGIGAKTSEKIIIDLKDKVGDKVYTTRKSAVTSGNMDLYNESIEALMVLGFKKNEVEERVSELLKGGKIASAQEIVKKFLQK